MDVVIEKIKNIKLTLNQWIIIRFISWSGINAYLWYNNSSLTDAIVINIGVFLVFACTKVHSVAIGMLVHDAVVERKMYEEDDDNPYFIIPPNKEDMN